MTDNNIELYLHDHTNTYSIAKAMFRNQNYNIGQSRYFDNNLSRKKPKQGRLLIIKVTRDQFRFSGTDHLPLPLVSINSYFSTSFT